MNEESGHETVSRVLSEEKEGYTPMLNNMREHVAYVEGLRVDRLYLARIVQGLIEMRANVEDRRKGVEGRRKEDAAALKRGLYAGKPGLRVFNDAQLEFIGMVLEGYSLTTAASKAGYKIAE